MARACSRHPENQAVAFCVKCGVPMCPLCEKPVEGRPYCQSCLDIMRREQLIQNIQKLQPAQETVVKVRRAVLMPFGNKELRRIIALIFDALLSLVGALPLSLLLRPISGLIMPVVGGIPFDLCYLISLFIIGSVYYVYTHWRWGRTLGKHLFGLKVERTDGTPLNLINCFWRLMGLLTVFIWAYVGLRFAIWVFYWTNIARKIAADSGNSATGGMALFQFGAVLLTLFLSLGIVMTFAGKYKRGFHDVLAGSIVKSEEWRMIAKEMKE